MKVEEKANEYAESFRLKLEEKGWFDSIKYHFTAGYNYATNPTTTEILQEGDWTKCEKFSEWVLLREIEGDQNFGDFDFDLFKRYNGCTTFINGTGLVGGEHLDSSKIEYKEFKNRAINTFKTK